MAVLQTKAFSPLARLGRRIRAWWGRQTTLRQLDQCDERDLQRVLHELNVTEPELKAAVIRGAYPNLLLPEMLQALGLQPERLEAEHPRVKEDLKRVCSRCPEKKRCRCELDAGTAASHYREFCFNATTLEALVAEAARRAGKKVRDEGAAVSDTEGAGKSN